MLVIMTISSCSPSQQIDRKLVSEVLRNQVRKEARFDRTNPNEQPVIHLESVEKFSFDQDPGPLEQQLEEERFRIYYTALVKVLQGCSWGQDRSQPRGFARYLVRPHGHPDNWMHITNSTNSESGEIVRVMHYFDLLKTDQGWLDAYGNYY